MKRRLRLTFVLPFVNLTGGIKILFEHANRLSARGHQVTIIYPGKLFPNEDWRWRFIEAPLRSLKYWFFVTLLHKTDAAWFPFDRRLQLIRTPDLSARYMPPGDIVIGTAPETINQVATYPAEKGIKVHFAQDYEVWDLPVAFVDSTFRHHNTHLITIGAWQKLLYEQKFGRIVEAVIPDGVDLARFKPNGKKYPPGNERPVRVLMNYHHASYKGLADGFAAIDKVRQAGHQITTVLFGMHPLTAEVPPDVEYHQAIAEAELPTLYRSCDIFLWPTHREGFGLPPMEALACGTPVVATDSGAVADYLADGRDGFIVPIQRPDLLAKQLEKLVADPKLRTKMGQAGAKAMLAWDWDNQTDKLETYLMKLAGTIKFK